MAGQAIKPKLFYAGESFVRKGKRLPVPITNQWVVYAYTKNDFVNMGKIFGGVARTDNKGIMYTCDSDLQFKNKKFMVSQLMHPWIMKKHYKYRYQPVTFSSDQEICLFVWPFKYVTAKSVNVDYLNKHNLAFRGFINKDNKAIFLCCPIDIYIERLKHYTKILTKTTKAYHNCIGKAMACACLLDQAHNVVKGRGRHIQISLSLRAHKKERRVKGRISTGDKIFYSDNIESTIINVACVEETRRVLTNFIEGETRRYKKRIQMPVAILDAIFRSQIHNYQYKITDWEKRNSSSTFIPTDEIIKIYDDALISFFQTGTYTSRSLYKEQFKKLVEDSAKGKAKSAIKKAEEKAKWIGNIQNMLKIVAEARNYQLASKLRSLSTDFKGVCYFLEAKGIITDYGELQQELDRSLIHGTPVNVDGFFEKQTNPVPDNIKGGIKAGVSAISLLAALQKESKNNRDTIDKATAIYGVTTDIMDIPVINNRIPKGAVVSKAAGVAGAAADWGISIYDMYAAADTGDGKKYAYSVVAYAGKGLVLGGSVLMLTPFAPLGAILVGVGIAVSLIGALCEGIFDYKSIEEKRYLAAMKTEFKKNDPSKNKWVSDYYDFFIELKKVKEHPLMIELKKQNPGDDAMINEIVGDKNFEAYVHNFFTSAYSGYQAKKLDV